MLRLTAFGFSVNNEIFAENSWYFRNSLVRANYNDLGKGISATTIYLEELAILKELLKNPSITQKELAGIIGKSERTIKTRTVEMQEKGLIRRENGKRNGRREVLVNI